MANQSTHREHDLLLRGIESACQEVIDGKLHDQFQLEVFQGGAGTSTNMNINEVIANRALELMGHQKGEYAFCDPRGEAPHRGADRPGARPGGHDGTGQPQ